MPRRARRSFGPRPAVGTPLFTAGGRSARRHGGGPRFGTMPPRRRPVVPWRVLLGLLVVAGITAGALAWHGAGGGRADRRTAAQRFVTAWEHGDHAVMWRALTPAARSAHPLRRFAAAYRAVGRTAGVRAVTAGRPGGEHGGMIAVPVAVRTADFGTLRGTVRLPVTGSGGRAGVDWNAGLRLPGLRAGEAVRVRDGRPPRRAAILAADGTRLDATSLGASIAGVVQPRPTGLERLFDARLAGHPSRRLLFGSRVVRRVPVVRGRTLRTTLRPGLMTRAADALGGRLGGIAVIRPRDGAVEALAGLAVSAPQPPGSTFKIITVSAALAHGIATPASTYPVRTFALLSGTKLRNASGEACGGTLGAAFAASCNSVFAPLGAKLGARRLVAAARAFGFDEQPRVPAAKPSTISPPAQLRDDLAVGAAAIGQDRDLATPLAMAGAGATIAEGGIRARPRVTTADPLVRRRAIPARVAREVRAMMLDVVRHGTGTAAALPGVEVAGKTGTAELRPNSTDPKDADAWFVAFAPARRPRVAVAVMLVGAGFGGTAAAPVARTVLAAALS